MSQQGFPDFQEQGQWSSIIQVGATFTVPAVGSVQLLAPTACAEWQSTAGTIKSTNNPCSVLVQWFYDQAGTKLAGERLFDIQGLSINQEFCFPNAGPYVKVSALGNGTLSCNLVTNFGFSNRAGPPFYAQSQGLLAAQGGVVVGAGNTTTVPFNFIFAGQVHWWTQSSGGTGGNWASAVEAVDRAGNTTIIGDWTGFDANFNNQNFHQRLILPAMQCQLAFVNTTAGALTFYATVVADLFH